MYLDHSAIQRIAPILEQMDRPPLLIDDRGSVVYPEDDQRHFTLPDAILSNPSVPLVYGGVTLIGTRGDQHLKRAGERIFVCLTGDGPEVRNCAILISEMLSMALRVDMGNADRTQAIRMILRGELDDAELESLAARHGIDLKTQRCVILMYAAKNVSEELMRVLHAHVDPKKDCFADVSRHVVLMMKNVSSPGDFERIGQTAMELMEAFEEAGLKVLIGVSNPRQSLMDMPEALMEARSAVNIGSVYRPGEKVLIYQRLLLERFLDEVPKGTGVTYGVNLFGGNTARLLNEEMVGTIETFFQNSLNLSETARKLGVHRNTLVYRLDKVQRVTGFDLRTFDDAVTFKMMMLLNRSVNGSKLRI